MPRRLQHLPLKPDQRNHIIIFYQDIRFDSCLLCPYRTAQVQRGVLQEPLLFPARIHRAGKSPADIFHCQDMVKMPMSQQNRHRGNFQLPAFVQHVSRIIRRICHHCLSGIFVKNEITIGADASQDIRLNPKITHLFLSLSIFFQNPPT